MRNLFPTIILLALVACNATTVRAPFNMADYADVPGTASISGQGFSVRRDGQPVTCAGRNVFLYRSTPYTREMTAAYEAGMNVSGPSPASPDFASWSKRTICDAEGRFEFNDLAAGDWIIFTSTYWYAGPILQGSTMFDYVHAINGKTVKSVMSR